MKTFLTLLLLIPLITSGQLYGDHEVAIINDKDGFSLIRNNSDIHSEVVDTLYNGEFFQYIRNDISDWYKVYKMWNTSGYVHKSRIQNLKHLEKEIQYNLIDSIFDKEAILYKERIKSTFKNRGAERYYHEEKFTPILDLFIDYMCKSFDETLLSNFFDILIIESGSADETPPTALGYIYKCQPRLVNKLVKEYGNSIITESLVFGKSNVGINE